MDFLIPRGIFFIPHCRLLSPRYYIPEFQLCTMHEEGVFSMRKSFICTVLISTALKSIVAAGQELQCQNLGGFMRMGGREGGAAKGGEGAEEGRTLVPPHPTAVIPSRASRNSKPWKPTLDLPRHPKKKNLSSPRKRSKTALKPE